MDEELSRKEIRALRNQRIPRASSKPAVGRAVDLEEHFRRLRMELAGATELEFSLARTIVMLRRGIEPCRYYRLF